MDLSIIIPSYNEEKRLKKTLDSVLEYLAKQNFTFEIIVVDDGSTDKTLESISSFQKNSNVKTLTYSPNRGKGYAVKKGVAKANGDVILFMDADNATPISELDKLLPFLAKHPIVIGSRYSPNSLIQRKQPLYRRFIGRIGNALIQGSLLKGIRDTQCGFKLFRANIAKELFQVLETERFGFDIEILVRAKAYEYSIIEIPVSWYHQENSRVRPLRDAFRTFRDLLSIRKKHAKLTRQCKNGRITKS